MSRKLSRQFQQIGEDYQTLCRLCLKKTSLRINIYQDEGLQRDILRKILNCLSLIVSEDDPLPKLVCVACMGKLDNFQDFRDMCHESENLLTSCVSAAEKCNSNKQHFEAPSASPSSLHVELGSEGNLGSVTSRPSPPQEPAPDFVSCSVKTEPQDLDSSFPTQEETITVTVGDTSEPLTALKTKLVEEQANGAVPDTLAGISSQDYFETDDGTFALQQQESECLGVSADGAQFGVGAFDESNDGTVEIEPEEVIKTELKIENEGPVTEGERYSEKDGIGRQHNLLGNNSHLAGNLSPPNKTVLGNGSTETKILVDDSVIKEDEPNFKLDRIRGKILKSSASKKFYSSTGRKRTFGSRDQSAIHVRVRTGEKQFSCSTCNKRFRRKDDLKRHSLIHTGEKSFLCSMCGKAFSTKNNLEKHSKIHTGEKRYICLICNKAFTWKCDLRVHSVTHTGENGFECTICNKVFTRKYNLEKHSRIHNLENSFECPICNRPFVWKKELKTHLRIHTGEKIFECSTCDKLFTRNSCLKKHLRIHTGEKICVCPICNKGFTRTDHLKKHSRIHSG